MIDSIFLIDLCANFNLIYYDTAGLASSLPGTQAYSPRPPPPQRPDCMLVGSFVPGRTHRILVPH
jgi:hypothetical protein